MNTADLVTLVDESDQVIGSMDKVEAHKGTAIRHRAISVYLFQQRDDGEYLLIQQRSTKKILGSLQWANTVCGNVWPNESYHQCAMRRLSVELGITSVNITPIHKFEYHLQCSEQFSEWEIDQVFAGWYDDAVTANPDEVRDFVWVKWEDLINKNKNTPFDHSPFRSKTIEITNPTTQQLNNTTTLQLSPWFVHMLDDTQLVNKLNSFVNQ